jgi:hypothetical protein
LRSLLLFVAGSFYQKLIVGWSTVGPPQPMLCDEQPPLLSDEHPLLWSLPSKRSSLKDVMLVERACKASILSMGIFLQF